MMTLICAETGETLAEVPMSPALANLDRRLIGGLAAPFNVTGSPSIGKAVFRAGSIAVPPNRSWVKLLVQHDDNQSVGYMTDVDELPAGLVAAYRVAAGRAGDDALTGVVNQTRDALSVRVEVDKWNRLPDGTIEVIASRLRETSLVSIPAFDDARVRLEASNQSQERAAVMTRLSEMLDLKASAPTPDPATPPAPAPAPDPATPPAPAPAPTNNIFAGAQAIDYGQLATALAPLLAGAPPVAGAPTPGLAPARPHVAPAAGPATIQAAAQVVADWTRRGGSNLNTLVAALSDVVPADDAGLGYLQPAWIGELWTASQARRPYIDALGTPKPLTAMTVKGWKWVTKPAVATYAGNKADIPSNEVETAPASANAIRKAGGWDVDRAYIDLGDPAFITALFEAATDDYKRKTNAEVGAALLAAATAASPADVTGIDLASVLVGIGAQAFSIGAEVSWVAVATDVFASLAALSSDDLPWWFTGASLNAGTQDGTTGNGGFKFFTDPGLASGRVLAGDRNAATFYEMANPIRVTAENIPKGGIDLGVFGYHALIVNDVRALYTGTVDATP